MVIAVGWPTSWGCRHVVAYGGAPIGTYAEEQILLAERLVHVPSHIDPIVEVSMILPNAHFLLYRCFMVKFR